MPSFLPKIFAGPMLLFHPSNMVNDRSTGFEILLAIRVPCCMTIRWEEGTFLMIEHVTATSMLQSALSPLWN